MYLLAYITVREQWSAPERERGGGRERGVGGEGDRTVRGKGAVLAERSASPDFDAPPARLASPASTSSPDFYHHHHLLLLLLLPPQPLHSPQGSAETRRRSPLLRQKLLPPRRNERGECAHRFAVGVRTQGPGSADKKCSLFELARSPPASHPIAPDQRAPK